jgi:long-chain acyl-CoA synthetase
MTNPMYVAREIESQWRDAGCTFAVTADFLYRGSLEGIRERLPVKQWIIASIPEALGFPLNVLAPMKLRRQSPPAIAHVSPAPNLHRFPSLVARDRAARLPEIVPSDLAALQYTGGTTGVAKGAMLTHANLAANAQQNAAWLPVAEEGREVFMGALPFFHVFGLTVAMNFPIRIGAKIVVIPNPRDVRGLVHAITRHLQHPGVRFRIGAASRARAAALRGDDGRQDHRRVRPHRSVAGHALQSGVRRAGGELDRTALLEHRVPHRFRRRRKSRREWKVSF